MATSKQLSLGPMALNSQNSAVPTPANLLGNAPSTPANLVGSVDLASIVVKAGARLGLQDKQMADMFGVSSADYSSAFSPNRIDRNRLMKQQLPLAFAREVALALCEATGLAVMGPDVERHALADVMRAMSDYLRVMSR